MNKSRGPGRVPGSTTIRFPVSVGRGMRVLASSKRMASPGTPSERNSLATTRPIAASWPVTPSTARKRISRSMAASSWIAIMMESTYGR